MTTQSMTSSSSISSSNSKLVGIIVGSIVGALLIIGIITIGVVFILKRRQRLKESHESNSTQLSSISKKKIKNIQILERLGGGKFGDVYRGMWQVNYLLT